MSQQHPQQPRWGQAPQQPGWGAPHQQPQPGWGAPPPQPPKKSNAGKIVGFSCLGVLALFVLIGIIGAIASGGDDGKKNTTAKSSAPANNEQQAEQETSASVKDSQPEEQAPVKITAKKTAFTKGILADGSNYTSVLLTVTNNGHDEISVNPLYFTITDSSGTKHTAELAVDEKQIETVTLAPGENVSGTITGKGKFTADYVTYTDGIFGDPIRINVP